jgi:hypothetical protein
MLVLEFAQIIYVIVDNDPEAVWLVVGRNVRRREGLRHLDVEIGNSEMREKGQ